MHPRPVCDKTRFQKPKPGSKRMSSGAKQRRMSNVEHLIQKCETPLTNAERLCGLPLREMRVKTMSTATATTFEVSNVKPATEPLPEVSYKEALEALLTTGILPHERHIIEHFR